ncbi:MAG: hypothetical protein KC502_19075 [Myxococcales bacterium]|nr:hypothetical protein [Myxococcales bacterium]
MIRIESVEPGIVKPNEPFKATWSLNVAADDQPRQLQLTFLTDDARLLLCDHLTDETPVEKTLQVSPGQKLSKSTMLHLRLRKGLRNEDSRDGSGAPLTLHARITSTPNGVSVSPGFDIEVAELAKRTATKVFI